MSDEEWAAFYLSWILATTPEPKCISSLQALQHLIQTELARLWAERNDSPGHVLREDGKR